MHSHLLWLGLAGHFLGYNTVYMWAWKLREEILDVMEILSGNRNNYGMFKPGGVRRDIKAEDIPGVLKKIDSIVPTLEMLRKAVMDDPVLQARTKGIGILSREDAITYSALGPTARASGVARDVRKNCPYAAYDQVDWDMIVLQNGDVFDKLVIRDAGNVRVDQNPQALPHEAAARGDRRQAQIHSSGGRHRSTRGAARRDVPLCPLVTAPTAPLVTKSGLPRS